MEWAAVEGRVCTSTAYESIRLFHGHYDARLPAGVGRLPCLHCTLGLGHLPTKDNATTAKRILCMGRIACGVCGFGCVGVHGPALLPRRLLVVRAQTA